MIGDVPVPESAGFFYSKKTSQANLNRVSITITRKNILMNLLPLAMAILAPKIPPNALHKAIGRATIQIILPLMVKSTMEPRLVARFTSFAWAEAWRKSYPSKEINARIRKLQNTRR